MIHTDEMLFMAIGVLAVSLGTCVEWHYRRTARRMLHDWARESGCTVQEARRCWIRSGPFPWPRRGQIILRFRGSDFQRREITGWARVSLVFKAQLEVRLD
jgi:hypothetical protein